MPATYSVKGELSGFRTTTRENIIVNADTTARVDFSLAVGNLEEGITVSGEAPLLDTTSALNQTVVDRTLLAALPSRNDLWSIGRAVPSVVMNSTTSAAPNRTRIRRPQCTAQAKRRKGSSW